MEIRTTDPMTEAARHERAERNFWDVARTLWQRRRFIGLFTGAVAVTAVVISLLIPNWYFASARVLTPDESGSSGLLSAALGNLSGAARSLIGGGGGDYTRYVALLTSRSVLDATIEQFDLMNVYDLADADDPMGKTRALLLENAAFDVDLEYDFLSIGVSDTDPERAAAMANFLVEKLNEINAELSSQNAGNYRRYVEERYQQNLRDLDSARVAMQRFQEQTGVVELPTTVEAYLTSMAELRASVAQADIQYGAALRQYGADNPATQAARDFAASARAEEQRLLRGRAEIMPVPLSELPAVASRYARLYQDVLIQGEMLKVIQPLYEQAKFEEERDKQAVQVVDAAVVPVKKAGPKRAVICIAATFSAFLLALIFVLLYEWLRRNRHYIAHRLNGTP